jgi:spermidine synthase
LLRTSSKWTNQDFAEHYDEVIAQLQRSVKASPNCAEAHGNLGIALVRCGRVKEAADQFWRVLRIEPNNIGAHSNLGVSLAALGQFPEAIAEFRRVLAIMPNDAQTLFSLADALASSGQYDEAINQYRRLLKIRPQSAEAATGLAMILSGRGRFAEAASLFRQAMETQPNVVEFQRNWAWLRATCPIATLRNGEDAVEHALLATRLCAAGQPEALDALAAAYAEAGRFPEALNAAHRALELAQQQNKPALADSVRAQIALYQAGKPFHERSPSQSSTPKAK